MRYGDVPEGWHADYEKGLSHLRRLLSLDRDNVRLLTAVVEVCGDWFLDLYNIAGPRTVDGTGRAGFNRCSHNNWCGSRRVGPANWRRGRRCRTISSSAVSWRRTMPRRCRCIERHCGATPPTRMYANCCAVSTKSEHRRLTSPERKRGVEPIPLACARGGSTGKKTGALMTNPFEVLRLDPAASEENIVRQAERLRQRTTDETVLGAIRQAAMALTSSQEQRQPARAADTSATRCRLPSGVGSPVRRRFPSAPAATAPALPCPELDRAEFLRLLLNAAAEELDPPPTAFEPIVAVADHADDRSRPWTPAVWQSLLFDPRA